MTSPPPPPPICFSWTVTSLSNTGSPALLFDKLGCLYADVQFVILLSYPSDNDCMGAVHSYTKIGRLQNYSD